jgi:predicted RecB family nuclease
MEIYDFEFGFRLDIAAVAQQSLEEVPVDLLVEPVWSDECPECPWLGHCNLTITAGSGDPSLLPGVGYKEWRLLRDHGITDRAGVSSLSYRTARLLTSKAEMENAVGLDGATLAFGPVGFLANAILNARAVTGGLPVYRLPGTTGTDVPRADIELDIDMESTNDGVYLWGVLVTDRTGTGLVKSGYLPFVTFDPIDSAGEVEVFVRFWKWMTDLMAQGAAAGVSVNAYCWYAGAENTQMRRIASADPVLAAEVVAFIASPRWIDMYEVFKGSWITGDSLGLKAIAPLAGHAWPVDDPGGGISMVKHVDATTLGADDPLGDEARKWLLDYNRGDVEATLRIRQWLATEGSTWPVVATN